MIETHPFGNFVPQNIRYFLLGSFIAKGFGTDQGYDWFYGSKRNQFWPILEEVYEVKLPDRTSKEELFKSLNMGIADIIYQCERKKGNSSDTNLNNIVYNSKLENILREKPVEAVYFTSRFVQNRYRKVFQTLAQELSHIALITLPSPSPRFAKMTLEDKRKKYKELLPNLDKSKILTIKK